LAGDAIVEHERVSNVSSPKDRSLPDQESTILTKQTIIITLPSEENAANDGRARRRQSGQGRLRDHLPLPLRGPLRLGGQVQSVSNYWHSRRPLANLLVRVQPATRHGEPGIVAMLLLEAAL